MPFPMFSGFTYFLMGPGALDVRCDLRPPPKAIESRERRGDRRLSPVMPRNAEVIRQWTILRELESSRR